jgi:hypothetical protein
VVLAVSPAVRRSPCAHTLHRKKSRPVAGYLDEVARFELEFAEDGLGNDHLASLPDTADTGILFPSLRPICNDELKPRPSHTTK